MSLRRKLLMVLLLTAVLPMMAVRGVQDYSIYRLQRDVAADMRGRLTSQAERAMQQTVDGYARSLDQERKLAFAMLRAQAAAVESRLAGRPPRDAPQVPTVRQFADYEQNDAATWEVVLSDRHAIYNDEGKFEPLSISYATQVVLPTGRNSINNVESRGDMERLADMSRVYREIHESAGDVILWQYTSLITGLHFSYPGKSGFPPGYSPQQRGWYKQAISARRPIGTRPFIDASTRQLIITFAQPIRGLRGNAAGVTAIDLRVSRLLDPSLLNTDWADKATLKVIAAYPPKLDPELEKQTKLRDRTDRERGDKPLRDDRPIRDDRPSRDRKDKPFANRPAPSDGRVTEDEVRTPIKEGEPDTSYPADVYVVADVEQKRYGRMRLSTTDTVKFDDPKDRQAVTDDLLAGRSGVRRVKIEGEDRMIAYGEIGGSEQRQIFALISAPTSTILAPSEAAIKDVKSELRGSLVNTGGILLLLLLVVGVIAFGLSDRLTRPIVQMAQASRRVAQGDLETRVDIDRSDELGQLGTAFNEMVPALHDRMRIRESLAVAMQVQQSLLPNRSPKVPGLDIAGHSEYCDETGGDYYDFIELDRLGPNSLAIAVGDVTGHGIAAALLMATGRALIRSHANTDGSLGEVFSAVNHQLCNAEFTGRFMTLMYMIVDGKFGEDGRVHVRYLSAGHDPIIVYRPEDNRFIELAGNDIPLGIEPDWQFHEHQSDELYRGDILVAGTDGIWECFNPANEQFGKDRLRDVIRQSAHGSADDIAKAISKACRQWRGERDQDDDITLVVVKLAG